VKQSGGDYGDLQQTFASDLNDMNTELNVIFYLTLPNFVFPVHWLLRVFFEFRTKRFRASKLTMVHWCEFGSFLSLALWEIEKSRFRTLDAR
jgi:hypothetical protein